MQIYNTLTRKLEEFTPLKKGEVKMYSCGPTVYSRAHIGNFAAYLMSDLIVRWLESRHLFFEVSPLVVHKISNITDVGHLVSDAETGEDKLEKAAEAEQISVLQIARKYEELYHQDEALLSILPAEQYPRATEYIAQMIEIIAGLVEKNLAYETEDGVYFSVEKFPGYGALSGNTLEALNTGAGGRVQDEHQEGKQHPADFALWKKIVGQNTKHTLHWPSPWGEGFPGWHIECSAMILATLGEQIDLHTGGEDNIFPHHECEIAQMEGYTGKSPFCRYWIHKRFIQLNAEKMSKSKGNVLNLDDAIAKGFDPLDVRYLMLSVHYRQPLNFTWEAVEQAREARKRLLNVWEKVSSATAQESGAARGHAEKFFSEMENDLNASGALAVVFAVIKEYNSNLLSAGEAKWFLERFEKVFGVLGEVGKMLVPEEVQVLVNLREKARQERDFAASDKIRTELEKLGWGVEDTASGQKIVRK